MATANKPAEVSGAVASTGNKRTEASDAVASRPIKQGALRRAEDVRNLYRLILAKGTRYEDLLGDDAAKVVDPVASFLTRGDTIEVIDEAGSFFAWLLLAELVPGRHVRFIELLKKPLAGAEAIDDLHGTGEWRTGWLGWERRYAVITPNGAVLRDGMRSRGEAEAEAHQRNKPKHDRSTLV